MRSLQPARPERSSQQPVSGRALGWSYEVAVGLAALSLRT